MSKVPKISSKQPALQNIPLRTDLGSKLRAALRDQQPRVFQSANFNNLEMQLHGHYVKVRKAGRSG